MLNKAPLEVLYFWNNKMQYFHTYLLITPYISVILYFLIFQTDPFFLKTRSSVQFLFVLMVLGLVFLNLLTWKALFIEWDFLKYSVRNTTSNYKSTGLITILAAIAAVCGWIFTARVQTINAVKSHSMQVLMSSRTSTAYVDMVKKTSEIRRKILKERDNTGESIQDVQLTIEEFEQLENEEKTAVIYMLNFLEFVAIGIRHYNLDEGLLKESLKSIVSANYKLYQLVIEHLRKNDGAAIYVQLELLHQRWSKAEQLKCKKCKSWFPKSEEETPWKVKYKYFMHIMFTLITLGIWLVVVIFMKAMGKFTSASREKPRVCSSCK